MDYGMIGKIEKAKRYAEQRDRIRFEALTVTFEGETIPIPFILKMVSGDVIATFSNRAGAAPIRWRWR